MKFARWTLMIAVVAAVFLCRMPKAECGAMVQRRVQAQRAAQIAAQQQAMQQIAAQQQAQQIAAYQQAMAARQAQLQQQAAYQKAAMEYAAYKQAMQQAIAQKQAAEVAAARQIQQMVARKQAEQVAVAQQVVAQRQVQAIQQRAVMQTQAQINQEVRQYADYLTKRQAVMAAQGVQAQQVQIAKELMEYNQYQQARAVQAKVAVAQKMQAQAAQNAVGAKMARDVLESKAANERDKAPSPAAEPETKVGIKELWGSLDSSGQAWTQIIDKEIKVLTVAEYIDRFRKTGIIIKKSPGHYAEVIDSIADGNPDYLSAPFMNMLSYAAIIEYDFENGQNKDELARKVLGDDNFRSNKARLQGQ